MADKQAGGSGKSGQTTMGPSTRKLTKGEAGFRPNNGIAGITCGDCIYFENAECQIVEGTIDASDVCDEFEPNTKDGHMTTLQATEPEPEARTEPLSLLDMFITRVSEKSGVKRWYATSSGVKKDLYGERMSVSLFDDFVRRIDEGEQAPLPFTSKAWEGGPPYLGVAHYLDLDGDGIIGVTEKVWKDGKVLKMKGTFNDTPMAKAAFGAIRKDRSDKTPDENRVRVSIAFVDWGHQHNHDKKALPFARKSMSDQCMYCEAGVGDKEYMAGHLVHLALTRRPAYPETEIVALEERSMSKRRDDAASIVGEELADELEARSKKLVGRSDGESVAAGAVVIKDDSGGQEDAAGVEPNLGGALTLDDAEGFLTRTQGDTVLLDSWDVLATILGNIAGDEQREPIRAVVRDFQNTLDVQTAQTLMRVERALGGDIVTDTEKVVERQVPPQFRKDAEEEEAKKRRPEEEEEEEDEEMEYLDEEKDEDMEEKSYVPHPLDASYLELRDAYDDALANSDGNVEDVLQQIQEPFNALGMSLRSRAQEAADSAPVDAASITRTIESAVAEALAPVVTELASIKGAMAADASVKRSNSDGEILSSRRRAIKMPTSARAVVVEKSVTDAQSPENPTPSIRAIARRSTIGFEQNRR